MPRAYSAILPASLPHVFIDRAQVRCDRASSPLQFLQVIAVGVDDAEIGVKPEGKGRPRDERRYPAAFAHDATTALFSAACLP